MSDQAPWEDYNSAHPEANDEKPWEQYAKQAASEPVRDIGADTTGMPSVPAAFMERLKKGNDIHNAFDRIGSAVGQGAGEGLGSSPFGIEIGSEMDKGLRELGIFNQPGERSPIRMMNEALIRPTSAAVDAVFRLTEAANRAGARGIAQLTAEVGGDQNVEKNTNELDQFGQIAMLLAGSGEFSRPKAGPSGAIDQKVGGLPHPEDFPMAAKVLTDGTETNAAHVEAKVQRLWQEHGMHPAEVVADAENNPVLHQQLLSRTADLPEEYAGLTPNIYGKADWHRWDSDAQAATATRQLKDGTVVPAPDAVATYLQQFGDEAGFKFQVGPETTDKFQDRPFNQPSYQSKEIIYPDGRKVLQGNVYIPDNADSLFRNWYGLGKNEVLFHEVGHALDHFLFPGEGLTTRAELAKTPGLIEEMTEANKQFAPKLWSMNAEYRGKGRELMADSIAAWLSNPELRKQMPIFTEKYGAILEKYKDIAERALPKKTDGINWDMPPGDKGFQGGGPGGEIPRNDGGGNGGGGPPPSSGLELPAPPPSPASLAAARQSILDRLSIGETPKGTAKLAFSRFYTAIVDKFFPISEARKGVELTAENDPYKLVRLYAGWTGKADHMLNEGTFDFHTYENNGPSLKSILDPVKDDLDGFRAFAAAARAAEMDSRGLAHGFDMNAVRMYGKENTAKYGPVMKQLVEYQNNVSAYLRDSGVLSERAYDAMLEANKLFVPFHRVMGDEATFGGRLGGANLTARNPIKTLEGSTREVIDPIESIIKNTYLLTSMAEKNTVGTKLIDMLLDQRAHEARDGRAPEMSNLPQVVNPGEGKAVSTWMERNGMKADPDLNVVLRDAATPDRTGEISIFRDGTRFTYQVDADLAAAMKGLDTQSIGLIERLFAPMASSLRAGAILNPEFAARHTIRDFLYSFIKTNDGFYSPIDAAKGLIGLVTKDADYWQWQKSGGANSTLVSLDRRYLQDSLSELNGDTGLFTRAYNVVIDPSATWLQKGGAVAGLPFSAIGKYVIHPAQLLAELAMNMNHLGGFKRALRDSAADVHSNLPVPEGSAMGPSGPTKGDLLNAGWQSRNTGIDIARTGSQTKSVNMISAFLNAKIQDTTQIVEAMGKTPISTSMRMAIGVTIPSLALWAYNKDDSRYQELPEWEKDVFWIVPTNSWEKADPKQAASRPSDQVRVVNGETFVNNGTIWRIPKPFSTGVLFGSGAERLADLLYNQNKEAFKGFFHSLRESTVGDLTPNAITPMLEQSANRTQYTGRTLIPQQLEKGLPEYQFAPYTSELAKKLGQVVSAFPGMREASVGKEGDYANAATRALSSPILIENYVRGWTGSLGTYAFQAVNKAGQLIGALDNPPHAAATMADIPLVKAFVARYPSANAQSISDFYDAYDRNQKFFNSYQQQAKQGNADAMARIQAAGGDEVFSKLDAIKKTIGEHYTLIRSIDAMPETQMKPFEKRQLIDSIYFSMIRVGQQGKSMLEQIAKTH